MKKKTNQKTKFSKPFETITDNIKIHLNIFEVKMEKSRLKLIKFSKIQSDLRNQKIWLINNRLIIK